MPRQLALKEIFDIGRGQLGQAKVPRAQKSPCPVPLHLEHQTLEQYRTAMPWMTGKPISILEFAEWKQNTGRNLSEAEMHADCSRRTEFPLIVREYYFTRAERARGMSGPVTEAPFKCHVAEDVFIKDNWCHVAQEHLVLPRPETCYNLELEWDQHTDVRHRYLATKRPPSQLAVYETTDQANTQSSVFLDAYEDFLSSRYDIVLLSPGITAKYASHETSILHLENGGLYVARQCSLREKAEVILVGSSELKALKIGSVRCFRYSENSQALTRHIMDAAERVASRAGHLPEALLAEVRSGGAINNARVIDAIHDGLTAKQLCELYIQAEFYQNRVIRDILNPVLTVFSDIVYDVKTSAKLVRAATVDTSIRINGMDLQEIALMYNKFNTAEALKRSSPGVRTHNLPMSLDSGAGPDEPGLHGF